jgi:hypothetical protein
MNRFTWLLTRAVGFLSGELLASYSLGVHPPR